MRGDARLRFGRVLAAGIGVWFKRFVPIHAVTLVCLAPLALFPGEGNRVEDGTIPGLWGLHSAAWTVSLGVSERRGFLGNVTIGYLTQFVIIVLVVRDAHRRLAGRAPRIRLGAMLGLVVYALGSLAAFALLDLAASTGFRSRSDFLPFAAVFLTSAGQAALAAWFALALPAAAVDGYRLFAALGRSARLGRGSRFRIAGPLVLLVVLQMGSVFLVIFLGRMRQEPWFFAVPAAIFLTLKACVLAAMYAEISVLKEGPPPEEIGAVFA